MNDIVEQYLISLSEGYLVSNKAAHINHSLVKDCMRTSKGPMMLRRDLCSLIAAEKMVKLYKIHLGKCKDDSCKKSVQKVIDKYDTKAKSLDQKIRAKAAAAKDK